MHHIYKTRGIRLSVCDWSAVVFTERGFKPVTNFKRNLSALSSWYSVYTSAIAFIVSQHTQSEGYWRSVVGQKQYIVNLIFIKKYAFLMNMLHELSRICALFTSTLFSTSSATDLVIFGISTKWFPNIFVICLKKYGHQWDWTLKLHLFVSIHIF